VVVQLIALTVTEYRCAASVQFVIGRDSHQCLLFACLQSKVAQGFQAGRHGDELLLQCIWPWTVLFLLCRDPSLFRHMKILLIINASIFASWNASGWRAGSVFAVSAGVGSMLWITVLQYQ
jgi:hypothetical protein